MYILIHRLTTKNTKEYAEKIIDKLKCNIKKFRLSKERGKG